MTDPLSLRSALAHDWLTGMRGGEKVLEALGELLPSAPIYTLFHFKGTVGDKLEQRRIRTSYLQSPARLVPNYRYLLPLFPRAIESLDLSDFDLVVSTSHCVAKGAITRPDARHICYCHTPMRYVWDQEQAYFPKQDGLLAALRRRFLTKLRRWDVATASRVDQYVANSTFVADRIQRYYRRDAVVVHPPVDVEFFTPGDEPRENFALVVSALVPYKRIDVAIAACRKMGMPLKVVGTGPELASLQRSSDGQVEFLGWEGTEPLRNLYRRAALFLQPGIEDFGIAPVEALACGCPVVALGHGGVLDIVDSGRHGVLFSDEANTEALASAIDKSLKLRFNFMNLRERSQAFSASRFRQKMSELLDQIAGRTL